MTVLVSAPLFILSEIYFFGRGGGEGGRVRVVGKRGKRRCLLLYLDLMTHPWASFVKHVWEAGKLRGGHLLR